MIPKVILDIEGDPHVSGLPLYVELVAGLQAEWERELWREIMTYYITIGEKSEKFLTTNTPNYVFIVTFRCL